jgi:inner membrane protein
MFSVSAQNSVRDIALDGLEEKPSHILVQPTPFNTLLWRILVMTEEGYKVGYYSLFDSDEEIDYTSYPSDKNLLNPVADDWGVQRLQWFTKGFYAVNQTDDRIVIQDLRMGLEPDQYVFQFAVAQNADNVITVIPNEQIRGQRDMSRLSVVWQRIWNDNVEM